MSGIIGQRVTLGQEHGPEVELIVSGTTLYATYDTSDGFPAIYDKDLGLFCYAIVAEGRFVSTRVPVSEPPPEGAERHRTESDEVRAARIEERQQQMERHARGASNDAKRGG